jgi:hypothetical protein
MILAGSRVGMVDEPLAAYRVRRESLSTDRVGMARGGLKTLEKARRHPNLTPSERRALDEGIAHQRRQVRERAYRHAIVGGHAGARRQALAFASTRGVPAGARVKAILAAAAPRFAGRRLGRGAPTWTGAGGVEVWADATPPDSTPGAPPDAE